MNGGRAIAIFIAAYFVYVGGHVVVAGIKGNLF